MAAAAPPAVMTPAMMSQITFNTREVPAPAALYITRDDILVLRVRNSVAGINVTCRGRYLGRDGQVHRFSEFVVPTSDRASNNLQIELDYGFLLSVTVAVGETEVVRRGQTFVQVFLQHGSVEAVYQQLLVSDYVTQQAPVGWPGGILRSSIEGPGMLRSITLTDPAAGVEISQVVIADARWRFISLHASLVTAAVAGARVPVLVFDDGANTYFQMEAGVNQGGGSTVFWTWSIHGHKETSAVFSRPAIGVAPMVLLQGHRIRTTTQALDPGDNWGAPQLYVEEWIEE